MAEKLRGRDKFPKFKIVPEIDKHLKKPEWLKIRVSAKQDPFKATQAAINSHLISTICSESSCPNIHTCFSHGSAAFLIMGEICTRRCPFCNVAYGHPEPIDPNEPRRLAETVLALKLKHVVITSVDRDDLKDGGASQFASCVEEIRKVSDSKIEILCPDFRGRVDRALETLSLSLPEVFNHNLETVPRLYRTVKPGGDYKQSLELLGEWKKRHPQTFTKSGLMVGLGESDEEILQAMSDLRKNGVDMITLGQYLAPSSSHYPVQRYVTPNQFEEFRNTAKKMGFLNCSSGPLVRSSFFAEKQFLKI